MATSEKSRSHLTKFSDLEHASRDILAEIIESTLSLEKHPRLGQGIQTFLLATESTPDAQFLQLYNASESKVFKKALEDSLARILDKWARAPEEHLANSFGYLFALVGDLKPWGTYESLVMLASEQRFKGMMGDFEDLHSRLLAVWLEDGLKDEGSEDICRTDINDSRYASVCYSALWQRYPKEGLRKIPVMIGHLSRCPGRSVEITRAVGRYISRYVVWGERKYGIWLLRYWTRMNDSLREMLCNVLLPQGLRVDITRDERGVVLSSLTGHSWSLRVRSRMELLGPWLFERDNRWALALKKADIIQGLEQWGQAIEWQG